MGGQYAFFREAFSPMVAFLYGWGLLLIVQSGATAAVAVAFAQYVARLVDLPQGSERWLAAAILLAVAAFHALGIKPGAVVLNVLTFTKTVALAALIVGAFVLTRHSGLTFEPLVPPDLGGLPLLSAFFAGLVPAMFAYGGWQNLNYVAEEVKEPQRNLPRADPDRRLLRDRGLRLGQRRLRARARGAGRSRATKTPAADMAALLVGETGAKVISLLIVVSTFGFMNLSLLSAPRVYYAMAADGLFFRSLGRLSPRFRAPTAAILLQGGLAAAYALANTYDRLLSYAVFADWIFFALAGGSLIVFRRTLPDAPRPFPVPAYPWVPLLFILAGLGIVLNIFFTDTRNALIGTAIFLLGVPVYYFWRSRGAAA